MFNAPWPNSSPPRALSSLTVSLSRPRPMAMSGAHEDKDANDDNRWEASAYMAKFNKIQYALFLAHHVWTTLKSVRISSMKKMISFRKMLILVISEMIHFKILPRFGWFLTRPKSPKIWQNSQHLRHQRQAHTGAWQLVKKDALVVHLEGGWGNSHPNLPKIPCESALTFHDFGKLGEHDLYWWWMMKSRRSDTTA